MRSRVSRIVTLTLAAIVPVLSAQTPPTSPSSSVITINTREAGTPFPHFWEQIFGSGRAVLSLRESYRNDLRTVKAVTDFNTVRFHGIFMDDVGLYDPNATTQNPGQAPQAAQPITVQKPDPLKRPLSDKEREAQQKALKQELKGKYKNWVDESPYN